MDRSAFAACAALMSLVFAAGCGDPATPPPRDHAPLVLAELKASSPGPWRRTGGDPVAPASLDRSHFLPYAPKDHAPGVPASPDGQSAVKPELRFVTPEEKAEKPQADRHAIEPLPGPPAARIESGTKTSARPRKDETTAVPRRLEALAVEAGPLLPSSNTPVAPTAAEHVTLPWANAPQRSAELAAAMRQADEHVAHGISLTERRATHLARAEFLAALQLIAQASDAQQGVPFFTDALHAGLTALEESHDFAAPRRVGKHVDVPRAVRHHQTPILKQVSLAGMSPTAACERYFVYAQEQLAAAAAREGSGSRALFGLGKLAVAQSQASPGEARQGAAEAAVYYQAALLADSTNGRAANELGVLLAHRGNLLRARDLLAHSASLLPHPTTQRNLAAVYAKLGQPALAEQATTQAVAMEQAGQQRVAPAVQWLDPATFAATAPASDIPLPPVAKPAAAPVVPQVAPAENATARKGLTDWLPWNTRR